MGAMNNRPHPDACSHPKRGGQEHYLGSGTGDYYCTTCGEAMPIIGKPRQCERCKATTGHIVPDPENGMSWRCSDCGKNWGWVLAAEQY